MRRLLFHTLLPCSGLNRSVDAFGRVAGSRSKEGRVTFGYGSPARLR